MMEVTKYLMRGMLITSKKILLAVIAAIACVGLANATSITWDLNCSSGCSALDGPDGNERTFTAAGGEILTVRTFTTTNTNGSGNFIASFLGRYGGGLGTTAPGDGNGSNNRHTVDNLGTDDLVVFQFPSSSYIPASVFLSAFGDTDFIAFVGGNGKTFSDFTSLSYATLAANGFTQYTLPNAQLDNPGTGSVSRTAGLNQTALNLSGSFLIIGANVEPTNSEEDMFKIKTLVADLPQPQQIPPTDGTGA